MTITVNPNVTPTFTAVAAICSGGTLSPLPTTSLNGITGTWAPALDNTATTTYTFTPTAGLCATTATLTITVNPNVTPTFTAVAAICSGGTLSPLPTTSLNGITGTWAPALNNTATTTYTFTPTAGLCATTATMTITVNESPSAIVIDITNASCGVSNGAFTLGAVTGGAAPYSYSIDGGPFTGTLIYSNLAASTYLVDVRDVNGCIFTTTASISNTGGPTAIATSVTNTTCGASNGSITLGVVTGGVAPYTYSVDGKSIYSNSCIPWIRCRSIFS